MAKAKAKKSRKGKKLNQTDFNKIKALLGADFSFAATARILERSYAVISAVSKVDTLKEYRETQRKYWEEKKAQKKSKKSRSVDESVRACFETIRETLHVLEKKLVG